MVKDEIVKAFNEAKEVLSEFMKDETNYDKIRIVSNFLKEAIINNNKIISCGNGGSMSDAMHFAEELTGRFRDNRPALAAVAISDVSHITCVANDFGFEYIFSRYVEALGNKGDVLLAISTSGNSENVIKAAKAAMEKNMKVIALTGKNGGELAKYCDIELRVHHSGYSDRIQEMHIKILHIVIERLEKDLSS